VSASVAWQVEVVVVLDVTAEVQNSDVVVVVVVGNAWVGGLGLEGWCIDLVQRLLSCTPNLSVLIIYFYFNPSLPFLKGASDDGFPVVTGCRNFAGTFGLLSFSLSVVIMYLYII
jgi:hypothetical protein